MADRLPTTARFSSFQILYWGALIIVEGFMVPYLVGIGLSERQAGFIMAAIYLVSVVSTPAWGYLADRSGKHKLIIVLALGVSAVAVLMIRASGTSVALIAVFSLVYSLSNMSLPPLIDSWIMSLRRRGHSISYEIARGFGSFGYAVSGVVVGIILDRGGLHLLFPLYAFVAVAALIVASVIRGAGGKPNASGATAEPPKPSATGRVLPAILHNSRYLFLVASIFVLFIGTRAAMTFLPLRIYALGGTTTQVGLAQSISAASEIPFMFLSLFMLRRFRPRAVILGAMILFSVRLGLNVIVQTPIALVLVQLLKGPSVGFLLPATVHYIDRHAPSHLRSLFQTLAPAIYFGLASVIGSSLGGGIIESFGLDALYISAVVVAVTGTALFGVSILINRSDTVAAETTGK